MCIVLRLSLCARLEAARAFHVVVAPQNRKYAPPKKLRVHLSNTIWKLALQLALLCTLFLQERYTEVPLDIVM